MSNPILKEVVITQNINAMTAGIIKTITSLPKLSIVTIAINTDQITRLTVNEYLMDVRMSELPFSKSLYASTPAIPKIIKNEITSPIVALPYTPNNTITAKPSSLIAIGRKKKIKTVKRPTGAAIK